MAIHTGLGNKEWKWSVFFLSFYTASSVGCDFASPHCPPKPLVMSAEIFYFHDSEGVYWHLEVEGRDAAKRSTMYRAALITEKNAVQTSIVLRLINPVLHLTTYSQNV